MPRSHAAFRRVLLLLLLLLLLSLPCAYAKCFTLNLYDLQGDGFDGSWLSFKSDETGIVTENYIGFSFTSGASYAVPIPICFGCGCFTGSASASSNDADHSWALTPLPGESVVLPATLPPTTYGSASSEPFCPISATCVSCPPGSFAGDDGLTCAPCPAGTYSAEDSSSGRCDLCPSGTFNPSSSSTSSDVCAECPAGTYAGPGSLHCSVCDAGWYSSFPASSSCDACDVGTFAPAKSSTACDPCTVGHTTYPFSVASYLCVECEKGKHSVEGDTSAECVPCEPGTVSLPGRGACEVRGGCGFIYNMTYLEIAVEEASQTNCHLIRLTSGGSPDKHWNDGTSRWNGGTINIAGHTETPLQIECADLEDRRDEETFERWDWWDSWGGSTICTIEGFLGAGFRLMYVDFNVKLSVTGLLFKSGELASDDTGGWGGAGMVVCDSAQVTIKNSVFMSCVCGSVEGSGCSGGALGIADDATVTLVAVSFFNNKAYMTDSFNIGGTGGAIFMKTRASGTFTRCRFSNNWAGRRDVVRADGADGGALAMTAFSSATLEDSYFYSNRAGGRGGGVFVSQSTLTVVDTVFSDCPSPKCELNKVGNPEVLWNFAAGGESSVGDEVSKNGDDVFVLRSGSLILAEGAMKLEDAYYRNIVMESGAIVLKGCKKSYYGKYTLLNPVDESRECVLDEGGVYVIPDKAQVGPVIPFDAGWPSSEDCDQSDPDFNPCCSFCPPGTFSVGASISCTKCEAGKYSNEDRNACLLCEAGYYSGVGVTFCNFCEDLYTISRPGAVYCEHCPQYMKSDESRTACDCETSLGFVPIPNEDETAELSCTCAPGFMLVAKECIECPVGKYKDIYGIESCKLCDDLTPRSITLNEGSIGPTSCVCPMGFFMSASNDCLRVKEGMNDTASAMSIKVVDLLPGFWRCNNNTSTDVRECMVSKACVGGTSFEHYCREGHEG